MRKAWLLVLLAPSALVYACGGDDTNNTDGGNDATANDVANDTAKSDGAADTGTTDATGNDGSTDAGADVAISITCLKPADCYDAGASDAAFPPDGGEVCCGTIVTTGTQSCSFTSASTKCSAPASCTTSFGTSCGTDTARLCAHDSECVEQNANPLMAGSTCCTAHAGDAGSFHICANSTLATLSQGAITCP